MLFNNLLKRITPTLKKVTHRLNGRFVFFNDEDLFQEAVARLWLSFKEGKLSDKTDSFILQGCYFYLKNYLRIVKDKAKIVSLEETHIGKIAQENQDLSHDHFAYLDNQSVLESFQKNGLTNREKQVLFFLKEGFTVREIGKKLGISHVMVVKIKKKIKEKLLFEKILLI